MTLSEKLASILKNEQLQDDEAKIQTIISGLGEYMVSKDQYNKKAKEVNTATEELTAKVKELEEKTLTAEQLKEKEVKAALEKANKAETNYLKKSNRLEAIGILNSANIGEDEYKDFLDDIVSTDLEKTKALATNIAQTVSNQRKKAIEETKKEIQGNNPVPPASNKNDGGIMTQEKFNELTYSEELKFAAEHPDEYKKFIK
jgi:outer membrane murein-binding lipoprotein Lpp